MAKNLKNSGKKSSDIKEYTKTVKTFKETLEKDRESIFTKEKETEDSGDSSTDRNDEEHSLHL